MTAVDADELELLQRQDSAAFGRLVERCQGIVLGIGQSLGIRGADLDDAAAEAFAEVYRALPRFEARAQVSTWVYRIAYRAMLHARQRHKPTAAGGEGMPGLELADTSTPAPGAVAEEQESYAALWREVARLEPAQAAAVELFYRREMSVEDIARVLDCPAGTVKTNLFRARDVLRRRLKGFAPEAGE